MILETDERAYDKKEKFHYLYYLRLGSRTSWRIADIVLNKGKSAIPAHFYGLMCFSDCMSMH